MYQDDVKNTLIENFRIKRAKTTKEIIELIDNLKDLNNFSLVQVNSLSLRQRLLEDSHLILDKIIDLKVLYRIKREKIANEIAKNIQYKMQKTEKDSVIEGGSAIIKQKIEILETQCEFLNESIRTTDSIIYGLKTRMEFEKYLRGAF